MITATLSLALFATPTPTEELPSLAMEEVQIQAGLSGTQYAFRGKLRVPMVRSKPDSKVIEVDVWLFPATGDIPDGQPPIVQLHGGPGWPGVEPSQVDWTEIAPLLEGNDLIFVGQRGIGTSTDTSCRGFSKKIDPDLPEEEQMAALQAQLRACREHYESEGFDLSGFNVLEAAQDVDDVRRLLGFDQIVLFGGSFGSHWSMAVMRYHPEIVARAVLHGVEGPDHTYDGPSGVLGALERIAAEAEASEALAGKLPDIGLVEALRTVIRSIDEDPFEYEVNGEQVPITAEGLRELARGYTSRVNSRRTVSGWPGDVMRLYEGDFELAAREIRSDRSGGGGLPTAAFFGLDCGSGITRERLERYTTDPAIEIVGDLSRFYESACPVWESDLGDEFRSDFTSTIPTVIVHGTWDVSTPFDNALELLPFFENLNFVPVEGGTHGAFGEAMRQDKAFQTAMLAFFATGATDGIPEALALPPIEWKTTW